MYCRDVDLGAGRLIIRASKRHKDRIVMLSDDVLDLCRKYNDILQSIYKDSEYFFPDKYRKPRSAPWLAYQFKKCWKTSDVVKFKDMKARIYDFRHTFATNWLHDHIGKNEDLYKLLPYLSTYMGHCHFSSTAYYVHLLPDRLKMSSTIDWQSFSDLIPEVAL